MRQYDLKVAYLTAAFFFAFISQSPAQTLTQQGSKLVGAGAVGAAYQGVSVALSADGNTAIVGGPGDNGSVGAAWVYTRMCGVWSQQGSKLTGTDAVGAACQGQSVALSADGNTAIVGGGCDNLPTGAAWVYYANGRRVEPGRQQTRRHGCNSALPRGVCRAVG